MQNFLLIFDKPRLRPATKDDHEMNTWLMKIIYLAHEDHLRGTLVLARDFVMEINSENANQACDDRAAQNGFVIRE
jgi:hypothetical protein